MSKTSVRLTITRIQPHANHASLLQSVLPAVPLRRPCQLCTSPIMVGNEKIKDFFSAKLELLY